MFDLKDGIAIWMNNAGRYPLLSKAEMMRIATIIQDPETSEKMRIRSIQKLVRHNLRLIPRVVRKVINSKRSYRYNSHYVEDMLQCGVVGLKRAAELYNPKTGFTFSTYAVPWIYQAVQRFAYNNLSQIRVPESTIRDLYKHIDKYKHTNFNTSDPVDLRLSNAMRALYGCVSSDTPLKSSEYSDMKIVDLIPDPKPQPQSIDSVDEIIKDAKLSKFQISIVDMVYRQNMSKVDAAEMLGVSIDTLKSQHTSALNAIRKTIS